MQYHFFCPNMEKPAIIVGYIALGGVGFTGGIATGMNRKNRGG